MGLNGQVTSDVVEAAWHVIFLKAIGCGFLVCSPSIMHLLVSTLGQPSMRKDVALSRSAHRQLCQGCITNSLAAGHVNNVLRHTEPGRDFQNPRPAYSLLYYHHRQIPHLVEYMYMASICMMLGARLTVGAFLWKCMLPITLDNAIGGAVFVGVYNWWA